tara:strand:- start:263 stop:472 length:210 start_codon:yes stop_codon:yes gene_type:complete
MLDCISFPLVEFTLNKMALTRKEELKYWELMPEPKPSWEAFKRMMPQFGGNPLAVQVQWEKKQKKGTVI